MNRNTLTYTTKPATPVPPVIQPDKYDEAIAYLTEHPEDLVAAWKSPSQAPGGVLFQFASPDGRCAYGKGEYGCLIMIRCGLLGLWAYTPDLTRRIREDNRLPLESSRIRLSHLPVFAEWQRRLDVELGRP